MKKHFADCSEDFRKVGVQDFQNIRFQVLGFGKFGASLIDMNLDCGPDCGCRLRALVESPRSRSLNHKAAQRLILSFFLSRSHETKLSEA